MDSELTPSITTLTLNPCLDVSYEFPSLVADQKVHTEHIRFDPGVSGVNVARALVELDDFVAVARHLQEEGVTYICVSLGTEKAPFSRDRKAAIAPAVGSGLLLAFFSAPVDAAWDNAKKLIEEGRLGGKGSPARPSIQCLKSLA